MGKKKKRRYYEVYEAIKSYQHITNKASDVVTDWEIRDCVLDDKDHLVNKRRRSKVGHIETRKKR